MTKLERAAALRGDPQRHYNCCQSVLLPFAEELGMDAEAAAGIGEHFGSGMRRGSVCGAVTGGLMALGLAGMGGEQTAQAFQAAFRARARDLDCAALLAAAATRGEEKKPFCDNLVYLAVELAEEMRKDGKTFDCKPT